MWSREFWQAVAERAASSFAWTLLSVLSADGVDLLSAPWWGALSAAGMAAVLSVLKSVGVNGSTGSGPSLATERLTEPPDRPGRHARPE